MGKSNRLKNKSATRLLVDKEKWGRNDKTYDSPPDFYYDYHFNCIDCKSEAVWTAAEQKRWYEELGKNINSRAVRCQVCRAHIKELKDDQKRHMEAIKNKPKHSNNR